MKGSQGYELYSVEWSKCSLSWEIMKRDVKFSTIKDMSTNEFCIFLYPNEFICESFQVFSPTLVKILPYPTLPQRAQGALSTFIAQ